MEVALRLVFAVDGEVALVSATGALLTHAGIVSTVVAVLTAFLAGVGLLMVVLEVGAHGDWFWVLLENA